MKTKFLILLTIIFCSKLTIAQNWEQISLPTGIPTLYAVFFLNEDKGWIVGGKYSTNTTMIYTTNNGGSDWVLLNTFQNLAHSSIYFFDENTGWLALGGNIYKTTNGGQNWTLEIETIVGNFSSMYFTGNGKGIAVDAHIDLSNGSDTVFLTSNNGDTWDEIGTGFCESCNVTFSSVFFIDELTGWIVTKDGNVLKTTDGGDAWSFYEITGQTSDIRGLYFIDETTGWVSGIDFIFKTTDGGVNWEQVLDANEIIDLTYTNIWIGDIYFTSQNNGWAFGSVPTISGYVLRTTDGGQSWEVEQSMALGLFDAFFLETEIAWVVGYGGSDSGRMYKYNANLSINEADFSNTINLYPNPAQDHITINNTSNSTITLVEIYNLLGAKVDEITVNNHEAVIDVSKLKTGTYFFKIYADSGVVTKKIIKR